MRADDRGLVIIIDKFNGTQDMNILNDTLDFSSKKYYNEIENVLKTLGRRIHIYNSPQEFIDHISIHKKDIVFSTLWGGSGSRNRKSIIASICEAYNICYVGADSYVQALAQDKSLAKLYCNNFNIKVPSEVLVTKKTSLDCLSGLPFPLVIKPNYEGSSVGISDKNIVYTLKEAKTLASLLLKKYSQILAEEYIPGREVSVCFAGINGKFDIEEVVELILDGEEYFTNRVWGYESKKAKKSVDERKIITEFFPAKTLEQLKNLYWTLGKVEYMRIDGRLNKSGFYMLELSPDCSLHEHCFMATAFYHKGYSYADMFQLLIKNAVALYDSNDI